MILCVRPTASVSLITKAAVRAATATLDEEGTRALRVRKISESLFFKNILCQLCSDSVVAILSRLQEVAFSSSNPWVLLLLICHDFSFHLSSFSVISKVSQIPWPLSHDL